MEAAPESTGGPIRKASPIKKMAEVGRRLSDAAPRGVLWWMWIQLQAWCRPRPHYHQRTIPPGAIRDCTWRPTCGFAASRRKEVVRT